MITQLFQTKEQQEEFNNLIRNCLVYDFNIEQTQTYIKNKIGIEFPLDTISRFIDEYNYDSMKLTLSSYKNNDDDNDINDHLERIVEIEFIKKELRQLCDKNADNPMFQVKCISGIRESIIALTNLYNHILFGIPLK